ncbi:MAG: NFACT family protein [Clostridia bacterium]|nr:NFACT family protein [Clostridia bacterium]
MAFDACMMRAVLSEIRKDFGEAKIEKVLQPQNDEVDLVIHQGKLSRRLIFNVGPNAPRLQLSDTVKENPQTPPMFCMLLRKKLIGCRIVDIEQRDFDRIAVFTLTGFDDMGYRMEQKLICEIMGKYANLILTDADEKIVSALKIIDFAASTVRQVLPGLRYVTPASQGKLCPLDVDKSVFEQKYAEFPKEKTVEKFITTVWGGIATQIAHELCFRATGKIDVLLGECSSESLYSVFLPWQEVLNENRYAPSALIDKNGKPTDYSYMEITYSAAVGEVKRYPDTASLFDAYFEEKDRLERIHQRAHDLIQLISNAKTRTQKKLDLQKQALLDSEAAEDYKKQGDLIIANIYLLKRGMERFDCVDYADENCPTVTVNLDKRLTPAQNAQRMYKKYNKCKNAKEILTKCIAEWEAELIYLDSVYDCLSRAVSEIDLVQIREELYRSGYASRMKDYRPAKFKPSKPYEFVTSGGYRVLVGKNNTQNDSLTFKEAGKLDLWFHVKDMPGSHVILFCNGEEPSENDYTEAASLAAGHSQATGDLVAVDYTRVKNVKKPAGAKPGYVIYHTNYTAFVKPRKTLG